MNGTVYEIFLWWRTTFTLRVGGVNPTYHCMYSQNFHIKIFLLRAQTFFEKL